MPHDPNPSGVVPVTYVLRVFGIFSTFYSIIAIMYARLLSQSRHVLFISVINRILCNTVRVSQVIDNLTVEYE